ncbi:hypothetical protein niasHT_018958 [Heterodera trifolii]|uniref:Post-SET domain-containing protein n=1 Tax=Heterodera trifolii TaxID=157864 RepID=A0ABD2LDT6_9BILA
MASSLTTEKRCKLFNTKQMECQFDGTEAGKCAFCVKLPCKCGAVDCAEEVSISCVNPQELEKCCKAGDNECCVCVLCEKNKVMKVLVECCGKRTETSAEAGKALCICVPKIGGGKCGGQAQVKQCDAKLVDECCAANTESGDCCCVCLSCNDQKCVVTVRCPAGEAKSTGPTCTASKCESAKCC